jgi:hypothetical protein
MKKLPFMVNTAFLLEYPKLPAREGEVPPKNHRLYPLFKKIKRII